jgi:hypothetical protein
MDFSLALAYGIASIVTAIVGMMGIRNQQSNWRRDRSDDLTDLLMAWADARHGAWSAAAAPSAATPSLPSSAEPFIAPATASTMAAQLLALQSVLSRHCVSVTAGRQGARRAASAPLLTESVEVVLQHGVPDREHH